jgi:DNA-binding transcriptional ArsR family regulator
MRFWAPLLIAVLAAGLLLPSASGVPEVLSFSDDVYNAGVSPEDPDGLPINATLRNPYPDDAEFLLTASFRSNPTWGIDIPDRISVPSRGLRTIPVKVFIPRGEPALEESELLLKATDADRGASWQAACTIRVMPYKACSISAEDDVLIDLPSKGSINVTVNNDGNIGSKVRVLMDGTVLIENELDPKGSATLPVPYEVIEDTTIVLEPMIEGRKGSSLTIRFFVDGERVHILVGKISALVALPAGPNSIQVLPIGGSAYVHSVRAEDGTPVDVDDIEVGALQRVKLAIDPGKDPIRRTALIRVNATMNDEEVESDQIPVLLLVKERVDTGYKVTPAMAGGAGGAVLVAAGSIGYLYAAVEGFRYRWLAIGFIPLYSIVHGEKVLDHFFRGRLYEYIKENPGVTFTALKKHFEVNNGNLTYHLHKLEKEELIVSRAQGKFKLFYPDGIRLRDTEIVISLMDKDIMDMVAATPGIASQDVVKNLTGLKSKRTVSRHIKDLERKGLIEAYGEHRKLYISGNYDSAIVKDGLRLSLDINAGT